MPERQDFGQVIKEARKTRGWTQADLADTAVARYLGGIALELWRRCTCFGHARRVVKYGGCREHRR